MAHPGESASQLEPGGYVVCESAGITDATSARVTIDPDSITVSGPAGAVPVTCISADRPRPRSRWATRRTSVLSPSPPTPRVPTPSRQPTRVPLSCSVRRCHRPWWARSAASGWPCSEVHLNRRVVWLIVAAVLGRRKPEPAAATGYYGMSPAPGHQASTAPMQNPDQIGSWYPDPEDPNQLRWWDGRQWTEHRRPR